MLGIVKRCLNRHLSHLGGRRHRLTPGTERAGRHVGLQLSTPAGAGSAGQWAGSRRQAAPSLACGATRDGPGAHLMESEAS